MKSRLLPREKHMLRSFGFVVSLAALAGLAWSAEVSFTAKPKAVKDGAKVKITFAVSAATDAEVAVVDSGARIVRHLAAGLLGENAPLSLPWPTLPRTPATTR